MHDRHEYDKPFVFNNEYVPFGHTYAWHIICAVWYEILGANK
jgi:hypothetical protein